MNKIFEDDESIGFINIKAMKNIPISKMDDIRKEKSIQQIPNNISIAVGLIEDPQREQRAQEIIKKITTFFAAKYSNSSIFENWIKDGKLPPSVRRIASFPNINETANQILRIENNIKKANIGLSNKINSKASDKSKIINNYEEKIDNYEIDLIELKNRLYMELNDLESSLGGEL